MFERPRGTRDFGPEDMTERRKLENMLRKTFESYGYSEVMTPVFERSELFVERSGPAILDEMYVFTDKGGRELALRPELTAPVMRFYASALQREPKPLKLYYFGQAFRYERPQEGRYREFWQMGLELIGADTPEATAEMISVAYDSMKNAGLKDFRLRIGNIAILKDFLEKNGMNNREIMRLIDKKDLESLPKRLQDFITVEKLEDISGPEKEVFRYRQVLNILTAGGIDYVMDIGIARGLDYYTGVVFEIEAPGLGAEKQICGGGEYRLAEMFGAQPVATSGFAIGFDRTLLALKKEGFKVRMKKPCVYIVPSSKSEVEKTFYLSRKLRNEGLNVEMEINGRSIRKALKRANALGSRYAVIVITDVTDMEDTPLSEYTLEGVKEELRYAYELKDMESGEQFPVSEKELLKLLKSSC